MYRIHSLGWKGFQDLCITIVREILGQTVESFLDTNDGGRDGAFCGTWLQAGSEDLSGSFVIQCKHTTNETESLTLSDLADELKKIKKLIHQGLCDSYVILTNAKLSGENASKIRAAIENLGVKHVRLFGATWITQQIIESKRLRMLVPRVYGLGDLTQILDDRAYRQAQAVLNSLREDLSKVVITDAYRRAAAALNEHGFVLLIGEPAAGKTTIASMLSITAVDRWKALLMKLSTPEQVASHWNPDEPSQFFWIDDAFGVSQYEQGLVYGWNRVFSQVRAMLGQGAKVVMTSRDYIYNRARNDLKDSAFPLLSESQVVIDVHKLTQEEKKQILYNHLKLGNQSTEFLSKIKPYLEDVAANQEFIPEIARRLGDKLFTKDLSISPYYLRIFVEKREQFLFDILKNLDVHNKAALALIFMRNDRLDSPIFLSDVERESLERLASNLGECSSGLTAMNGSLVLNTLTEAASYWRFKHPTISDSFGRLLLGSLELLGIYLRGTSAERLLTQITCGNVGLEKAIVVPQNLFPDVLEKLGNYRSSSERKEAWRSSWLAASDLDYFLARRCSKDFLSMYIESNPGILKRIANPGLYLHASSEIQVAKKLHELGLLPEAARIEIVEKVSNYAIEGDDLDGLSDLSLRELFTDSEFDLMRNRVKEELFSHLDDVRYDTQNNFSSDQAPEDHMEKFLDTLKILSEHFGDDPDLELKIAKEREFVNTWISDNQIDEQKRDPRFLDKVDSEVKSPVDTRSIFDDIDV